ncbi:hypothetical protein CBW65_21690 [Tumebacillus avium]|uniref:Aminoglycoside phosphotransferase domain-containing protein n=1 Tax=Tumebacillus avium TaxID=1903704 RepID=A0A1Y0IVD6_9BACL|nr:phosphotransferase [Tumebacillus avium]ARU63304.1 hypothetical protein CBW65_21690 [Tumebacillus avium]
MNLQAFEQLWPDAPGPWTWEPAGVGFINLTYRVQSPLGSFFSRIYQNCNAQELVQHEIRVMELLDAQRLSFAIPVPVVTATGQRTAHVVTAEGQERLLALFPLIPGQHPQADDPEQAEASGRGLGELVRVMGQIDEPALCAGVPLYGALEKVHPLVPDPLRLAETLPVSVEKQRRMAALLQEMTAKVPELYDALPRQLIHRDYTKGNTLLAARNVTGVLDFEFCARDLRALDLAIGLGEGPANQMWGTGAEWVWLENFARGYASEHCLTAAEVDALPMLMRLRRAYFLLHFAGRCLEGLDSTGWLRGIVDWVLDLENWMEQHAEELIRKVKRGWDAFYDEVDKTQAQI